jgi:rare lipoprotein A
VNDSSFFRSVRAALIVLACMAVVACGSKPARRPYVDGAPGRAVDISKIPQPVPRFEPLSKYGNKNPYSVFGKEYRLLPERAGYLERGKASWYGTKFHGLLTSNREAYDMYAYTAAHKTLPLPTFARVTNLDNGRSITVRINDRGPFVDGRIIDLSYVAAIKLDMHMKGTANVEVEAITPGETPRAVPPVVVAAPVPSPSLDPNPPKPSAPQAVNSLDPNALIGVQCGAFSDKNNALSLVFALSEVGFSDARVTLGQDGLHRVVFGPVPAETLAPTSATYQSLISAGCLTPKRVAH